MAYACGNYNKVLRLYCEKDEGHEGFHATLITPNLTWGFVECGNKTATQICTREKDHKGPHENDKGWTWPKEEDIRIPPLFTGCVTKEDIEIEEIKVKEFSGVISTKIPRFELIPFSALEALARIFEAGIAKKGDGAWNALTPHKNEALKDKAFVIERLSHVIKHCYQAIRKVQDGKEWEGEEDAGAVMFGGAVLAEYKRMRKEL